MSVPRSKDLADGRAHDATLRRLLRWRKGLVPAPERVIAVASGRSEAFYNPEMDFLISPVNRLCDFLIAAALRCTLAIDDLRRAALKQLAGRGNTRSSLRLLFRRWLLGKGSLPPETFRRLRGHRPHNRTPDHVELALVRLHVERLQLGSGQLRRLAERVLGVLVARETVLRLLIRRRGEIELMTRERKKQQKRRRRIAIRKSLRLWGLDLTLVWLLGFFPVWLLGIVGGHGSCGPTPNEVYFGKRTRRSLGRVSYFDGALSWCRCG